MSTNLLILVLHNVKCLVVARTFSLSNFRAVVSQMCTPVPRDRTHTRKSSPEWHKLVLVGSLGLSTKENDATCYLLLQESQNKSLSVPPGVPSTRSPRGAFATTFYGTATKTDCALWTILRRQATLSFLDLLLSRVTTRFSFCITILLKAHFPVKLLPQRVKF